MLDFYEVIEEVVFDNWMVGEDWRYDYFGGVLFYLSFYVFFVVVMGFMCF